jgi:peptidoglycan hydrolase-like protein with peptidoglycan-binding domain
MPYKFLPANQAFSLVRLATSYFLYWKINMNVMRRNLCVAAIYGTVSMLLMLILSACDGMTVTPSTLGQEMLLATPALVDTSCEACAQATLAAALTQQKNSVDNQAAATAEIVRANAQATVNSANATLSAALTQEQNNANVIAAQIAATAEIVRANAQATLNSAGSTQVAALTQSQYNLQVTMAAGTQTAEAIIAQQNKNDLAASTQTAVANNIATQTQIAVATSQWYTDQERQREEQRQGPIAFLWMWCLPIFIVLLAGLLLWGFWRWLKIQQTNQRILENPVEQLPALEAKVAHRRHDDPLPIIDSDIVDDGYQVTKPDDVEQWLDEVKGQLLASDEKDKDDNTDN